MLFYHRILKVDAEEKIRQKTRQSQILKRPKFFNNVTVRTRTSSI